MKTHQELDLTDLRSKKGGVLIQCPAIRYPPFLHPKRCGKPMVSRKMIDKWVGKAHIYGNVWRVHEQRSKPKMQLHWILTSERDFNVQFPSCGFVEWLLEHHKHLLYEPPKWRDSIQKQDFWGVFYEIRQEGWRISNEKTLRNGKVYEMTYDDKMIH